MIVLPQGFDGREGWEEEIASPVKKNDDKKHSYKIVEYFIKS
jgi:hypothetical protein